jgi:hypothetical protein
LITLQKKKVEFAIHGIMDRFIKEKKIEIMKDFKINVIDTLFEPSNVYEKCVFQAIKLNNQSFYPTILKQLVRKPIFSKTQVFANRLKQQFLNLSYYKGLNVMRWAIFIIIFGLGLVRLFLGLNHEKEVGYLIISFVAMTFLVYKINTSFSAYLTSELLPNAFRDKIRPTILRNPSTSDDFHWSYFMYETTIMSVTFLPLYSYFDKNHKSGDANSSGTSCGSSCGASCGSSCSSGCGGCGGGD